jgi:hypothetical protein
VSSFRARTPPSTSFVPARSDSRQARRRPEGLLRVKPCRSGRGFAWRGASCERERCTTCAGRRVNAAVGRDRERARDRRGSRASRATGERFARQGLGCGILPRDSRGPMAGDRL